MQSPPSEFEFDARDDAARNYLYLSDTARPLRAATQWLSFRFRLTDFCRHTPASHFAIVLRARLEFDATGVPTTISGRGMTLGNTSLARPVAGDRHATAAGFGGARGAQVESYWPFGNFLYRDSGVLPEGLVDSVWYRVWLHVNDERWIAFGLGREDGAEAATEVAACVQDREAHPVRSDATGVLIALGRGANETGSWRVEFRDIATGWF
jgi:hypothetical protein